MRKALLPLATSMLFAGSYIGGKYTTLDLGPLTTTLLRYFIALLFLACLLPHYRLCSLKLAGRDFLPMLGLGLTGVVGYHYFFFSSLRYTDVANTGIINALSPAVTGIAAAILIGERLSARSYAGVVLACIGVLVLLSNGDPEVLLRTDFNRGDVLMLIAVLCWTAYALLVKTLATQYSSYTLTFYATLFGVLCTIAMVPAEDPVRHVRSVSTESLLSVVYMGIGASGLGYLLYNMSIREIGPTRTASFVYSVVAVLVAILAFLFFAEAITAIMIVAAVLILSGLHLMMGESKDVPQMGAT